MVDFCTNIWLNGKVVATFVYKLNIDIILFWYFSRQSFEIGFCGRWPSMGGINEVVDRVCKLIVPGSEVLTIIMCCINICLWIEWKHSWILPTRRRRALVYNYGDESVYLYEVSFMTIWSRSITSYRCVMCLEIPWVRYALL